MSKDVFYITLVNGRTSDEPLKRQLDAQHKGKTFGEVVEYMLIPEGDELNEEYSPIEKRSALSLKNIYNSRGEGGSVSVNLYASRISDGEDMSLSFPDSIQSKLEDILKVERFPGPDGKEIERQSIYLSLTKNSGGGI
jgi:hypothetical protein